MILVCEACETALPLLDFHEHVCMGEDPQDPEVWLATATTDELYSLMGRMVFLGYCFDEDQISPAEDEFITDQIEWAAEEIAHRMTTTRSEEEW